jgi:type VI secretion system secreted protein Hcp
MFVKKLTVLMILILTFAAVAAAQGPPGLEKKTPPVNSTITIKIAGLRCTTAAGSNTFTASSYGFGATQTASTGTGGGGGAGKATIMPLNATKSFDACSPDLFGSVVLGQHLQTVELVHQDDKGNTILTINLTDALITSYQIGGSQSNETPQEIISIDFTKICISEPSSGNKLCFDRATNKVN